MAWKSRVPAQMQVWFISFHIDEGCVCVCMCWGSALQTVCWGSALQTVAWAYSKGQIMGVRLDRFRASSPAASITGGRTSHGVFWRTGEDGMQGLQPRQGQASLPQAPPFFLRPLYAPPGFIHCSLLSRPPHPSQGTRSHRRLF